MRWRDRAIQRSRQFHHAAPHHLVPELEKLGVQPVSAAGIAMADEDCAVFDGILWIAGNPPLSSIDAQSFKHLSQGFEIDGKAEFDFVEINVHIFLSASAHRGDVPDGRSFS
jgi:hypothetical protein